MDFFGKGICLLRSFRSWMEEEGKKANETLIKFAKEDGLGIGCHKR
jgi:hypothetical protein